MARHWAFNAGAEACDADWEIDQMADDPHPDDCPSIQSDLEVEQWREGYLTRRQDILRRSP